jgi:hypothetical protein
MHVDVQVQRSSEALDQRHRTTPPVLDPGLARRVAQKAEHGTHGDTDEVATQVVIPRETVAQEVG